MMASRTSGPTQRRHSGSGPPSRGDEAASPELATSATSRGLHAFLTSAAWRRALRLRWSPSRHREVSPLLCHLCSVLSVSPWLVPLLSSLPRQSAGVVFQNMRAKKRRRSNLSLHPLALQAAAPVPIRTCPCHGLCNAASCLVRIAGLHSPTAQSRPCSRAAAANLRGLWAFRC